MSNDNFKPTTDSYPYEMTRNFYWGEVLEGGTNDPLMLGRIRVSALDETYDQRIKAAKNFDPEGSSDINGPWSKEDPFVYLPFLPFFINQVPQENERVMLFFFDRRRRTGRNKFYMIATYSSPLTIGYENSKSSRTHLDDGYSNSQISLPSVKNPDGTYKNPEQNKGIFAEPIDISIQGRDTSDIILKKNEMLLRSGKHLPFEKGQIPILNNKRAFIQLSNFDKKITFGEERELQRVNQRNEYIKFLIEYYCITPNVSPNIDVFTGGVYIYGIPEDEKPYELKVGVFDVGTNYTGQTHLIYSRQIIAQSMENFSLVVNQVIKDFKDNPGSITSVRDGSQFVFYYRPDYNIREIVSNFTGNIDVLSVTNMTTLMSKIKASASDVITGYGLVINKDLDKNLPIEIIDEKIKDVIVEKTNYTTNFIGADSLYLLSHETVIPGKFKVNLDNTLYGIEPELLSTNIEPNTSPMVRGEELMELLQLIVQFLVTHDHPYPMMPPTPKSKASGIEVTQVLTKLEEAYEKILNQKIRIN